jgi:hypothetical protein
LLLHLKSKIIYFKKNTIEKKEEETKQERMTYINIQACELALESVEDKNIPIVIKYITTRLSGKALEAINYKNTSRWTYIKKYLTGAFEVQHSISSL